ncbi:MAG: Hsp70 family protein [Spirochaetota bacterium]
MENSVIAVQLADGTFVPVLNTTSSKRRRLVVTTVRDNQENVKIELFRGSDESMGDAEYVGSLVIDNVEAAASGTPDISVLLAVDESGNLNATATDTKSGEYQSLSVSLEQLEAEGGYDMPDFQLSDEELTLDDLSLDEEILEDEDPEDEATGEITDEDELEADLTDEFDVLDAAENESPLETELDEQPAEPEAAPAASDELSLDDLSFDEADDEMSLDDISLDEEPTGADELSLDEISFDEEPTTAGESDAEAAFAPAEPTAAAGGDEEEADELEDVSFEDVSFDEELEDQLEEPAAVEGTSEQPAAETADTLGDLADEEFTFDESLTMESGFEGEGEETVTSVGEDDFDLGSLTEEESGDEFEGFSAESTESAEFSEPAEFSESADDDVSLDSDLGDGMVEADLGDEDFTFDEGGEDEPLFPEPGDFSEEAEEVSEADEELEDTLSAEEFERLDSEPVPAGAPEPVEDDEPVAPRRSNAIIFVGYMILALAALGVLTYLVFRLLEGPPAPPLRAHAWRLASFAGLVPGSLRSRSRRCPRRPRRRG